MGNDFIRFQDENQTVSLCREKVTLLHGVAGKCVIHMDNGVKISLEAPLHEIASQLEDGCANCQYRIHSETISKAHDCNDCGWAETCGIKPDYGHLVRINCYLWKRKEV